MPKQEPPRPPQRQPSRPEIQAAQVDKPVGVAVSQQRFDRPPPRRTQTLPGIPQLATPPLPAAAPDLPPTSVRVPADEAAPQTLRDGQDAALRAELAKSRAHIAQLERDARAAAEAKVASYPPPVQPQRHPSPPPVSSSAKVDEATGKLVRHLLRRFWPLLLGAAGLGAGGAGALKPTADPAKQDATLANVEAMRTDLALIREQLTGLLKREAMTAAYVRCLEESLDDVGAQVLPAQDRAGAAQPLRAYVSRCQRLRP